MGETAITVLALHLRDEWGRRGSRGTNHRNIEIVRSQTATETSGPSLLSVSPISPPSSLIQFIAIKPPIVRRSLLHRSFPNIHIHTILLPYRRRFLETIAAVLELWVRAAGSAPVRCFALGVVRGGQISARWRSTAGWGWAPY